MEIDFFDEEGGVNGVQRNPAPVVGGEKPVKGKIKWWQVLLCVGLAVLLFFSGFLVCWSTLDPEIRTIIGIKRKIDGEYYKEVSDEEFYRAIFGGLNASLDDYSYYMTPEEFAAAVQDLEGNRDGIGLVFNAAAEEALRVTRVCGNSPAEQAGILAGEKVVGFGGGEAFTPCTRFEELTDFLDTYEDGQEFYLQIEGKTGEKRSVKLSKKAYVENYVFYRTKTTSRTFTVTETTGEGNPMPYLPEDTAYIRLVQFTGDASLEFGEAMEQFKADGKKNLVLDLRGNGGGYLDTMQEIASYFCKNATEKKPIVAVADYGEKREKYRAKGNYYTSYFSADSRVCVLADSSSASASECLLGCMLDYGAIGYGDICLAERNGIAKTFGKGIMQETYILNYMKQDALKLTTAEIRWPTSDTSIHGRGILLSDGTLSVSENIDYELETQAAIEKLFG